MSEAAAESDASLAARAARGDDPAFATLLKRHDRALFGFVRRYVGDPDGAMEVVQESFIAAWKALGRYDPARPFPVWLRAIALNKCRDRARRGAVRRLIFGDRGADSLEAQRQADPAPSPEADLVGRQRRASLDAAIAGLPRQLKEPLLLTYFGDLTQHQAAELLGVSVKAVETRVYRARQKLAEQVGPDAD